MGLAASQARFLGLTARKSNIEYEGQQVNQQRTALAEEVNALYNRLASLVVPIAPDPNQFYKSCYSFTLSNTNTDDGDYIVKNYYRNDGGKTYYLNTERTYNKNVANGTIVSGSTITKKGTEEDREYYYTPVGTETPFKLQESKDSATIVKLINEKYPTTPFPENEPLYYFSDEKATGGQTCYFAKSQLDATPAKNLSYYVIQNEKVSEAKVFTDAVLEFDSNNRISKITVDGQTNDVDTTRTYNQEGYDSALRDYTMSKDEYNQKVQELNAKTESLQQEDKILEMRLDQISTEQNELKTELEAVKSILKDNIENTFNTFT